MLNHIKNFLYNPLKGFVLIFSSILILSYFTALIIENLFFLNMNVFINFFVALFIILILFELIFVASYYFKNKKIFRLPPKVNFDKIHYKGHPYIPYVLKEKVMGPPPHPWEYPLHKGKYKFHEISSNNLGFFNGPYGNRDVNIEKPQNTIRVNCLGASTTQNYLVYEDEIYSYPLALEKKLNQNSKINFEVNNFGQGGYNSADILVRFLLQTIDTKPDVIILYHGYADVRSYLSKNFKSDYSHSRFNLSEKLVKLKFSVLIPRFPLSFLNFFLNKWFPFNLSNSLVEIIHKQNIDININPDNGLKTFERNIQNIIDICKAKKIEIILSTFCHILYKGIEKNPLSVKYEEIVEKENDIIKKLANENDIKIVDNAKVVPKDEKFFVDSIHFSHLGMELLAQNFAEKIKEIYDK